MFSIDKLLAPVSEQHPCGDDIAFSSELDAIARARQADDPSLEQGAWVTTLKEADWKFVANRCATLIESRSKDLQLAVWLAEASARTGAFRGLGDSLLLIAALCELYWDGLFPLPDEGGFEQRVGNLCWIAARLPPLMLDMPITEGEGYSMNDADAARLRPAGAEAGPDLEAARRRSSRGFYEALLADTAHCMRAIGELEKAVDDRLGADGPGFSAARATLQDVIHVVRPAAREAGALTDVVVGETAPGASAVAPQAVAPALTGQLQSRAEALAQLRLVAEFFRRTEPHSPVAYLAEKAASWGEQPLHVWLRSVVKDPASCAQLEDLLGVAPAISQ